ncbi:MAG: YbaB/EbfC family nucleoid-associated protein [Verrucomicrobia bacterium]|nr:YbaB/EbfC family nucleoid-associated protein [Verrucomicrobiota bacterium]
MNPAKLMKQMQKMQQDMQKAQDDLAKRQVEVTVGGGSVTVVANCAGDVLSIKIKKEAVDPDDVEMLEDLILSGVKQAIDQGRATAGKEMSKLTAGLPIPPGFM